MFTLQGASKLPKPNNEFKYREIAAFSLTRSPLIRLNKQSDINTLVSKAQRGRLTRARLCFYPYPFWACARPWGTAEENQVLTQHENRWQSKCGASWEISPLWACHCIPLDGFSHVFAMTAAWWKHQPTPGQREREGKKIENQRGEVAEESSPIRYFIAITWPHSMSSACVPKT